MASSRNSYGAVTGLLGRVPHFYRTISNAPFLAMLFLPINAAAQREWPGTRVSGKIKEMVVIKTSHTNGCDYLLRPQHLAGSGRRDHP